MCIEPLVYALYTHECVPSHSNNSIIKFADDMTVVGLISGIDMTAYRDAVQRLTAWCTENNFAQNSTELTTQTIAQYTSMQTLWKGFIAFNFHVAEDLSVFYTSLTTL